MNIMKTNMLLLDNKRIMKDETDNGTVVQTPVTETKDATKGMNALTFQGMKNVLSNPQLSNKLGNMPQVAKEGASKASSKAATAAMMLISTLLPASMLTSCDKDINVQQEQKVDIKIDAILAMLQKMYEANLLTNEELQKMRADINAWQVNQNAYNEAVLAILTQMGSNIIDIKNGVQENNAYQQVIISMLEQQGYSHDQAVSLIQTAINLVAQQGKSIQEAMQYIINQLKDVNTKLDTVIDNQNRAYNEQTNQTNLLKGIHTNTAEAAEQAKKANAELRNIRQTIISCNNTLSAKLDNIKDDINTGFDKTAQEVGMTRAQLLAYMKKMNVDIQNSNTWNAMMIKTAVDYNTHVTQMGNNEMTQALADLNAGLITVTEFAERTTKAVENTDKKMSLLASLINKYGSRLSASANAALAELIKGNIKQDRANYLLRLILGEIKDLDANVEAKLQAILNKEGSGNISQEDIDAIISLLQNIDTNVQAIKTTVDKIYDLLQQESKKNDVFRTQMIINGRINTQIALSNNRLLRENNQTLNNMEGYLADLNTKVDSLITLGNQKPDELKAEIARLRQENSAWLAKIDIDQNMGTAAIIAKLRDFQNTYVRTEREEIKLQKQQNNMLNYAIALLKNPSKDNTEVLNALQAVINAINSGKEDITAELQKANNTLNALLEKVGLILDEMGKLISTVKVYGDQIINKFGTNEKILEELKAHGNLLRDANGKLDLNNLTLAELKAEAEKIKPELKKLNTAANTANNYLDIISKKQAEMDVHIQNIDNGNGITAEELDSLWNMHDANAFAKAKAYMDALHIDDMKKADEIIALMKKGNETNNNIYIKLSDFANKTNLTAEQLRALLKAVYDYLPELKCNCNCQGDCDHNTNHEGIIGDLIS